MNNTFFDEILLLNRNINNKNKNKNKIDEKELCEWLNENYTFCSDNFQPVTMDSFLNTKNTCAYYKILLKHPNPILKIKYISFVSYEDYKGPKFNIQYQDDDFLNRDTIIKLFGFLTHTNIYQDPYVFDQNDFDDLMEKGYYYLHNISYHIAMALDFHIIEIEIDNLYIDDIQWTSDNRKGKITKNLSGNRDEFSCYN